MSESETPCAGEDQREKGRRRCVRHAELGMRGGAWGCRGSLQDDKERRPLVNRSSSCYVDIYVTTMIVRDFNTHLSVTGGTSRQKTSEHIAELQSTISYLDPIDSFVSSCGSSSNNRKQSPEAHMEHLPRKSPSGP